MDIYKITSIFNHLTLNKIVIPEIGRAMILLAACLHKYDSVSSVLIQANDNTTLNAQAIIADVQNHSMLSQQQQNAAAQKISAVKHQGPNPNWVPQNGHMQPEASGSGSNSKGKQPKRAPNPSGPVHGNCRGHEKKKADKKQHGHLASVAVAVSDSLSHTSPGYSEHFLPLPSKANLLECLADVPSTKDPCKQISPVLY